MATTVQPNSAASSKNGNSTQLPSALLQGKDLQAVKAEAEDAIKRESRQLGEPDAIRRYAKDLRDFIESSGIVERKAFLKSFVDRIEVDKADVTVVYTLPIMPDAPNGGREAVGVLRFINDGPPTSIFVAIPTATSRFSKCQASFL